MISSTLGRPPAPLPNALRSGCAGARLFMLKWFHHFSMVSRDLSGHHALVTGAAQGIGFAIAQRLHAAGAAVALLDVDATAVSHAARELAACSDGDALVLPLAADVADARHVY